MKKVLAVFALFILGVSSVLAMPSYMAPLGFGAKYGAMGGAGAAQVDDIFAAYYNPAGIVGGASTELKIGAQAATEGLDKLSATLTGISDPAKYMADNFPNAINIDGDINAMVGLQFADIGLSVMPSSSLSLTKAANSIVGTLTGSAFYDGALTFGTSYYVPALPIGKLDVGANIKSANYVEVSNTVAGLAGTGDVTTYTGMAYDLGAKASVQNLPIPLAVAVVYKDINATLKGTKKSNTTVYNASGAIVSETNTTTNVADLTVPTTLVIGLATEIPGVGLKIAIDQDSTSGSTNNSLTHYGLQYPVLAGLVELRVGKVSDTNSSIDQTTYGAGINIGLGLNVAMMTDNKNSKNNQTMVDFGFAF